MIRSIVLCSFLIFAFSIDTMAHSINLEVEKHSPTITVHAYFSKDAPLGDASVEVFSPGNEEAFQKGNTDKKGFFTFKPNDSGTWEVTVDDGMGHFDRIEVNVPEKFYIDEEPAKEKESTVVDDDKPEETRQAEIPLIYRIIFGLALIFGLTGIIYGIKAKQSLKK